MDLIIVNKNKVFTDSLKFSEKLDVNHRNVLKDIRELVATNVAVQNEFIETTWTNAQNRIYPKFEMTKKGFMSLIMNTNVTPAKKKLLYEVQNDFINAFEMMEKIILQKQVNENNLEWNKSREQGKQIRLETTDTIKEFVEYATNQGSKSANMYYKHFTNAEYKALGFIQQAKPNLRDTLNLMQLHQLILAEDLTKRCIKKYMKENLHYKEIYILVKQDIENFAKNLLLN